MAIDGLQFVFANVHDACAHRRTDPLVQVEANKIGVKLCQCERHLTERVRRVDDDVNVGRRSKGEP